MGCGTSMNTVVPLHYIENQNGSSLWNNKPGSDVLDYMTAEEMKQADIRAQQVTSVNLLFSFLSTELWRVGDDMDTSFFFFFFM